MEYPALDRLEALAKGLDTMQSQLTSSLADIAEIVADGVGDSDLVLVQARTDGTIIDVRIDPRAMRMGSETLAEEFRQAANRAREAAAEQTKERVRTLLAPLPEATGSRHRDGY